MSTVGQRERATQDRVVKLFQDTLGYTYLGNWQARDNNSNIEADYLSAYLSQQGYTDSLISKTLYELNKITSNISDGLYYSNQAMYSVLRYGVNIKEEVSENAKTVRLIDWNNPLNNQFSIAEEVTIRGEYTKRPDIILYVNGIALGMLELKRSIVAVSEGIRQNLASQSQIFIQPFFTTLQFIMAGNDTEGLRYGVIETPERYYLSWKERDPASHLPDNLLDQHITQLCEKTRFLELIHDFIAFDAGTKKVCRPSQYFSIKAAQKCVDTHQGGIIWHMQGSGKSLLMVWLAKWIRENKTNARVLIITDRNDLDEQIEKVFLGANEKIYRCKKGADLIKKLSEATPSLICSLIHKFKNKEEADYTNYIAELEHSVQKNFTAFGNWCVFIDECHRTQSGSLHQAMRKILPDAILIGFTGTPLLKKDKKKSIEIFGGYIDIYPFNEAVEDGVVLDLRYEARDINQLISSHEKIDQWFRAKTKGLNDNPLTRLKQKWGTLQKVFSSHSRLEKIVSDIIFDMDIKDRLNSGRGNAMLIASSIYEACKLYELFIQAGFTQCALVTSYRPSVKDIRGEHTGEGDTEKIKQFNIYRNMLNGQGVKEFERSVKKKFINEPGQMKLLIVVDKLLTGFDAPPATYIYIDKKMQDHELFQAICRVNRLDGVDKDYGYIIDYKGLFGKVESSVRQYTARDISQAFAGFDKTDVDGLFGNRLESSKQQLEVAREAIKILCEPVDPSRDSLAYIHYFCGTDTTDKNQLKDNERKRILLYKQVASLLRAFANIANEYTEAGYSYEKFTQIKKEVNHYENVRKEIKLASGDYVDLKMYEPAMRHLIDNYINAEESEKISAFDDISLVQLIAEKGIAVINNLPKRMADAKAAVCAAIENNIQRFIIDKQALNPKYYETMSKLLDELIKQREANVIEYKDYLEKVEELSKQINNPSMSNAYPDSIDTLAKRALYDNLGNNAVLANILNDEILHTKKDSWRGNKIKEREVLNVIKKYIAEQNVAFIFELVKKQQGY